MQGAAANDMGPANLRVVPPGIRVPLRIEAILALKDCGLPLGEAKAAMETMLETCHVRVALPGVPDLGTLREFLAERDIAAEEVGDALTNAKVSWSLGYRE